MDWDKTEIASKLSAVELNSKFTSSNFSKGSNKGNTPKASDIVSQVNQQTSKKGSE